MKKFEYSHLQNLTLTHDLLKISSRIHEYKGKQELYIETKPDILNKLTDLALIKVLKRPIKLKVFQLLMGA